MNCRYVDSSLLSRFFKMPPSPDTEWITLILAFIVAYIGMFILLILLGVSTWHVFKLAAKHRQKRLENSGNAPLAESWYKSRWIRFLLVLFIVLTALTVCIATVGDILVDYVRTILDDMRYLSDDFGY